MNKYDIMTSFIDYSTSSKNRKHIISSVEIGLGLLLLILGIGTATCDVENKEKEIEDE